MSVCTLYSEGTYVNNVISFIKKPFPKKQKNEIFLLTVIKYNNTVVN